MHIRILLIVLACCACGRSLAFESWEHKRMGDLAYHIALRLYCESFPDVGRETDVMVCGQDHLPLPDHPYGFHDSLDPQRSERQALKVADALEEDGLTYGDLVACVDYFLSTEKLIAGREVDLITRHREGKSELSLQAGILFPETRRQLKLDHTSRCDPSLLNREGERAGHVNHIHFQVELLLAQRTNHMLALSLRTQDDNLFSALALNAISDHYLHDSFAPGHITTWRSRLTDLAANAYHDVQNRRGLTATVTDRSRAMLRYAKSDNIPTQSLEDAVLIAMGRDDDTVSSTSTGGIDHAMVANRFFATCYHEQPCVLADEPRRTRVNQLVKALDRHPLTVEMHGDNQLWLADQDVQRFLLLVTEVRSILDVLQSRRLVPDTDRFVIHDSFAGNAWIWDYRGEENKTTWQRITRSTPSAMNVRTGPILYAVDRHDRKESIVSEPPPDGWQGVQRAELNYDSIDRIYGVSLGIDNLTFGDTQNRRVVGFETVLYGRPVPHNGRGNWGVLAGLQAYTGPGKDGIALTMRPVIIYQETELAVSFPVRILPLRSPGEGTSWRPLIGLRFDHGLSSFTTFYLQGGRDAALQKDGSIRSGWSIGAGVQLAAPKCRIPLVRSMSDCR